MRDSTRAGGEDGDARRLPSGPIAGKLRPPGSKSLAIRALLCAGLAEGRTRITGLSRAQDVEATLELLRAARVGVRALAPTAVELTGRPPGPQRGPWPSARLQAGESGTLARLASALLGLCGPAGERFELGVSGSLARRSSPALFAALERAGVAVERLGEAPSGGWPVRLRAIGPPATCRLVRPSSSQEASALLLALAAWPGESLLELEGEIPSRPYLEMTRGVLERFGASCVSTVGAAGESFLVRGPFRAPERPFEVEPDASAAAVALAAACLSGGAVEIAGLGKESLQGDVRILEHLAAFGCKTRAELESLHARGLPCRGADLNLAGEPDLAPVLAAVAGVVAMEGHSSRLSGLKTLQGKESPRITVLAEGLRRIGLSVEHDEGELRIAPGAAVASLRETTREIPVSRILLDPRDDHRMAFAFALLALRDARVHVVKPECVAKSWPNFWSDLSALIA